jgi:hypothetical protein
MIIKNPWVGVLDRTYDQYKDNILTKFQAYVPEVTDHTDTNPWVKGISIWSGLMEVLHYYLDNDAREVYLSVAQEFSSAVKIAKMFDYRVKGSVPSSVTLRFSSSIPASGPIIIPVGTQVKTANGEIFTTTILGTILTGQSFVDISAKQWEAVTNVSLGNSTGLADQEMVLEEQVVDNSITFIVNVTSYSAQETFAFSFPNSEHFLAGLNENTEMVIRTGDGINGKIPPAGQPMTASYYITQGSLGNVGAGKIIQFISSISVPGSEVISVNNLLAATGGADYEDLNKLKKRIPLSIRTKYRAVTDQDFIDVTELYAGVEKAGVFFDCDVDKYVHVYLVPEGGGPASNVLIGDVTTYLNARKIITTLISVESAGVVPFILVINATALPGYSNALAKSNIEDALVELGSSENQTIRGKFVIGDIYQAIEESDGVLNSIVTLMVLIPYARNLTTLTNNLNWTREILPASAATTRWLIRFITNSNFELFREDDFIGSFAVDTLITQTEVKFTVIGNHAAGDNYQFYTYAYNSPSVTLEEPSIPTIELVNLTVNVTGGV